MPKRPKWGAAPYGTGKTIGAPLRDDTPSGLRAQEPRFPGRTRWYLVTLLVPRYGGQSHPSDWNWEELVGTRTEALSARQLTARYEPKREGGGPDD